MAFPMPPAPRLSAEFFWECPTCQRAFARPETAAQCHRPPQAAPTVAAPLVRWPELAMFEGDPLALTGWPEADQAELTVLHRRPNGTFKATRQRFCASRRSLEPTGAFALVRV
jgi:hypothetical protein